MTTTSPSPAADDTAAAAAAKAPANLPPVAPALLGKGGVPPFGVYRGIPDVFEYSDLASPYRRNPVAGFMRHKRWMYLFAATDDVIVVSAVVDAGPTGTGFCMVTDRATGEVLADVSRPGGLGPLTGVNERPTAGHRSRYVMAGTLMTVRGDERELRLRATFHRFPYVPMLRDPWIDLDLRLDTELHAGTTTIAELAGDHGRSPLTSATAKNAALPTRGQITIRDDGRTTEFDLSGGFGGFDYTNGFLPRHTSWRWAFLTGRLPDGRSLGINLVSGFSGLGGQSRENMCWLDGTAVCLDPAATIAYDADHPDRPWQVSTADGAVDLEFTPLATHRESLNLGAIRSKFVQPTGHFSGVVTVAGQRIDIDAMPGVVEDQDVLW